MSRKKFPRCVGACRDGTQCGRRVIDGSQPPLCHLHNGNEHPSPIIPPVDAIDPLKILRKLARDPKPEVRLKAIEALLKLEEKLEAKSAQRQPNPWDALIEHATDEERAELFAYFDGVKDLKRRVAARLDPAPPVLAAPASRPTEIESAPTPTEEPVEESLEESEPAWTPARYEAAGFIWLRELRIWQHPLGDAIGDRIFSGAISFEDARSMTDAAAAQSRSLAVASTDKRRDVEQWDAALNRSTRS